MQSSHNYLAEPAPTSAAEDMFEADRGNYGFVMNLSHLWAHLPETKESLFELMGLASKAAGLSLRQRGVLVTATAATLRDSYCSLAWGTKLSEAADEAIAAAVLSGSDAEVTDEDAALARWARLVANDPNAVTTEDVAELRQAGFDDRAIFGITLYVALRLAFSTVNDALGASPDGEYGDMAPESVRRAVDYGRPIAPRKSGDPVDRPAH